MPTERLPTTAGLLILIRRVSTEGMVSELRQYFRMGKRHHGLYLRLMTNTDHGCMAARTREQLLQGWPSELRNIEHTSNPAAVNGSHEYSMKRSSGRQKTLRS
jgi:hypothetical protein